MVPFVSPGSLPVSQRQVTCAKTASGGVVIFFEKYFQSSAVKKRGMILAAGQRLDRVLRLAHGFVGILGEVIHLQLQISRAAFAGDRDSLGSICPQMPTS